VPDWLREIAPAEAVPPEAALPAAEAALEEVLPEMPTPAPAEVPDWLREIAPAEVAPPEAAPPAVEAAPEEVLPAMPTPAPAEVRDWLREIAPAEVAPPEAAPPAAEAAPEEALPAMPTPAPAEVPDWLREIAPAEAVPPEAAPPAVEAALEEVLPEMPTPAPAEVPDWLREIAPAGVAPPEAAPPAVEAAPEEITPPEVPLLVPSPGEFPAEVETTGGPEWLAELDAEPAPPSAPMAPVFAGVTPSLPPEPGIEIAEAEGLARAEIPGWLKDLRPRAEVTEVVVEEEPLEAEGLLEGLRGVITPTAAVEVPAVRRSVPSAEISEASLARAQLLQSLLVRPAEVPQPKVHERGIRMGERIQRWLVAAVLIMAVVGILAPPTMGIDVPTLTHPIISSGVTRLYDVVQGVSAGDTVLVAFEYGPSEADELNLVAEPILRHLLDQGVDISIVSTQPEGKRVAEGLLNGIVASEARYIGVSYTRSDYRPGGATGVSQLLADADTSPELIFVLTAQPGPLRWWVEQSRLQAQGGGGAAVVAGLSAALEPAASPYLDVNAGQLEGVVNGLSGAAAYETRRGSAGQATRQLNALAVGHIVIVGLMILGAVFYAPSGLRRRKK